MPSTACSHAIVPGVAPVTVSVVPTIVPVKLLVNAPTTLLLSGNVKLPSVPKLYIAPLALNHRSAVVCNTPLPLAAGSKLIVPSTPNVKL